MLRNSIRKTSSFISTFGESAGLNTIILPKMSDCVYNGCSKLINYGKTVIHGPTAEEITEKVDLTGKTCLITGGTSGIGREMIRVLIKRNCNVIMACRNLYAASMVAQKIPGSDIHLSYHEVNLGSLASVKKFVDYLKKENRKIDILLLNAAVFGLPWTLTVDGLESIFQINYLSQYFILQNVDNLLAENARVVFVSSESHRNVNLEYDYTRPLDEFTFSLPKEKYTSIRAYNLSKLCGILAMHAFAYRWMQNKEKKSIFCAHPGSFVRTNLARNWWVWDALYTICVPFTKTIPQAAATPIYCCTSPELNGQSDMYFKDCKYDCESNLANELILSFRVDYLTKKIIEERLENLQPMEDTFEERSATADQKEQVVNEEINVC